MQPTNRGNEATPHPRQFVDPDTLFGIDVPRGWFVDSSGQMESRVILLHPQVKENFRTNINVIVPPLGHLTQQEFLTLTRLQIKQISEFQLVADRPASELPGAHLLEWVGQPSAILLQIRQLLVPASGKVYVITGTALQSQFEEHRAIIESTLNSFRLLQPQTTE
jgi:hypothetical protein